MFGSEGLLLLLPELYIFHSRTYLRIGGSSGCLKIIHQLSFSISCNSICLKIRVRGVWNNFQVRVMNRFLQFLRDFGPNPGNRCLLIVFLSTFHNIRLWRIRWSPLSPPTTLQPSAALRLLATSDQEQPHHWNRKEPFRAKSIASTKSGITKNWIVTFPYRTRTQPYNKKELS